jgi:hypothetical protein
LLTIITKRKKKRLPTIDEFLILKPRRADYEWELNSEGLVEIKVPKFNSNFGKSFVRTIKRENYFIANMDKKGSVIWQNCDGKKTVAEILEILKKEFPNEKEIDQRLFLFIQQMQGLNYLEI